MRRNFAKEQTRRFGLVSFGLLNFPARKGYLVSKTPTSPVVLRVQQSALIFVVLVLALGALLLASNSIDPKASERAGLQYVPYTTGDGLITLEYPKGWTVNSPVPLAYSFTAAEGNFN